MRFFFLHNPKAGGTALRSVLAGAAHGASLAPTFGNAPNEHAALGGDFSAFGGFENYFGHYGFEVYEALGQDHVLVTNFRDPVRRVYSMYRYWRNNVPVEALAHLHPRDAAIVRSSHELSFSDFIRQDSEELRIYTQNFHARQLHRDGWRLDRLDEAALDLVKRRISAMAWFYIAESPEVSMYLFAKAFPGLRGTAGRENVSTGPDDGIADADAAYIAQHNALDYAIYVHAWQEQVARLTADAAAFADQARTG